MNTIKQELTINDLFIKGGKYFNEQGGNIVLITAEIIQILLDLNHKKQLDNLKISQFNHLLSYRKEISNIENIIDRTYHYNILFNELMNFYLLHFEEIE